MKKGLLILLCFSIFLSGCQKKDEEVKIGSVINTPVSMGNGKVQKKIDEIAKKYGAVGLQVAIVDNGIIAGTYTYGWATKDEVEMTIHHKMRVASISKVLVGLATMILNDEGVIDLDEGISQYWNTTISHPLYPNTPITIKNILNHTSSIIAYGSGYSFDYDSVRERFRNSYTSNKPGQISSWHCNNYAISVLGMTLELASGKTLDELLQEKLYESMDIDASFASGDIEGVDKLVTLYRETGEIARTIEEQLDIHTPTPGSDGTYFSGGLTISAADLAKIIVLLVNDGNYYGTQLIDSEYIEIMESYLPDPLSDGSYQALPLFYGQNMYGREGIYFHSGSAYGVYNCLSYDPITRDGVIVLSVGAKKELDDYDICMICTEINDYLYSVIE